MIRFELKKILRHRLAVILILLLLAINGVVVWNLDLPGVAPYTKIDVSHILSLYRALPEDKTQALVALENKRDLLTQAIWDETDPGGYLTKDLYTERQLFVTLIERVEPVVDYPVLLQEIDTNAETLLLTGRYVPNSFEYKNVVKSRQIYAGLQDVEPKVFYSGAVELLPGGGITEVMAVLLSLLVALELIFSEREQGTLCLCKPTYHGGVRLILAKIVAGLIWAAVGTGLLYGSNALIGVIRCGGVDLSAPIQSVFGMIRSPWKLTVGQYFISFFAVKILWTSSVMAVAYVAAYLGKKVWQCFGLFFLLGGLCFLRPGSVMNPFSAGDALELFGNYWNLNFLGMPISNLTASVLGTFLILLLGFGMGVILHVKQVPGIGERNSRKGKRKPSIPTGLMGYEGRKLFLINGGIYILLILMVTQVCIYADFPHEIPPAEQLYIRYSHTLSGKWNEEKDAFIAQEEARFADLYRHLDEYGESLTQGNITEDSYLALTRDIMRQLESEPVFHRARDQYLQMKAKNLDYVCLTGYNRLLGTEGKREILRQSILLILGLTAGLSGVYATEYETGMFLLRTTTEGEAASDKRKRILAIFYAVGLWAMVYIPQLVAIGVFYGLPGIGSGAGSVPMLGIGVGTVWSALALYGIALGGFSVGMCCVILLLSKLTRNTVHTALYASALFLPICVLGLLIT